MGSQQTAASPLRLAILEADAPQPQTAAAYGTYGGLFASLFGAAVERYEQQPLSSALHITKHDVVNFPETAYPSLDDIDALLITGSRHSAYDGDEWIRRLVDYTRSAIEGGRVKVVGVCFGHQIVALALGGRVARNEKGWEVSVMDVQLNEEGKRVFGLEKMRIYQMHRDEVVSLPDKTTVLASTDRCAVQAFYIPGRVITVQGHPEFTASVVREILELRHSVGVFDDETFEDAVRRVEHEHDGVAIARAFLRFLRE